MHENRGEDCIFGCFSCPLKSSYEDFTNPLGGGRRPFLSLGSRDTGLSRRFRVVLELGVCVMNPRISGTSKIFRSFPNEDWRLRLVGDFPTKGPRGLNPGRRKKDPHDFVGDGDGKVSLLVCLWCYYVITYIIISSSIRFLFTGRCLFTLSCELPK